MTISIKPKKPRKPSWFELTWFIMWTLRPRQGLLTVAALIPFLIGLVSMAIGFVNRNAFGVSLVSVGVVVALWRLHHQVFSMPAMRLESSDALRSVLPTILPSEELVANAYVAAGVPHREDVVIRSDEVDRRLRASGDFRLELDWDWRFRLIAHLREAAPSMEAALRCQFRNSRQSGKEFTNETKLGLAVDLRPIGGNLAVFQGSYFMSFLTNELSRMRLVTAGECPTVVFNGLDSFPWVPGTVGRPRLLPLSQSWMGNHVGVSTVAYTADGYLQAWRQTERAQQSEHLLAPTGSGSCDWSDLDPARSLIATVASAMERELLEESHRKGVALALDMVAGTAVLGYYRWAGRAGKPEFVGVTRLATVSDRLNPNVGEVDAPRWLPLRVYAPDLDGMQKRVEEWLGRSDLSVPLWVSLLCLRTALAEDGDRWTRFFWPSRAVAVGSP